ncbi:MAG: hypothetical protein PSV17_05825 [Methylotenera sp.]|uniref:PilN domain-containing protein n=1 Tax=Methylotenera sp. TaxID=2051956 RepID=UPI0024871F11|nr:PilN domain-containing protein [Methylotenera sp.]MDI1308936.1 hypothetical protein [Methylotenera sp.]
MKSIHLNHEMKTSRNNAAAMTLLVIGSLLSVALSIYSQQLTSKTELLQIDMQQHAQPKVTSRSLLASSRALLQSNNKEEAVKRDEIATVNAAIKEIVMPWPALFKTLESANREEVKLLALEPGTTALNAQQRTVRITAVALDANSMMRYVDELTQLKMLKDVALLSQESTEINGQKAIQFVIEAVWKI